MSEGPGNPGATHPSIGWESVTLWRFPQPSDDFVSQALQTAEADRGQAGRRPIWFLTAACLVTAAVLLASVWGAYDSYRRFGAVSQRGLRIQELRGQIIHLDEVLTMSARMAAASGAPHWEARYRRFEPQLGQAIDEAESLVSDVQSTGQTDAANEALVALEERAFDLVRRGRLEQARAILAAEQYAKHKATYAEGMESLGRQLQDAALSATRSQEERALLQLVAAAIALPLLVAGWLVVLRITDRWRRDVVESHRQLVELNRSLDQKVVQRTAALERATKEANAANEAKSAFLANMSHELRTPMNAIIGYSELLMEEAEDLEQEEFVPDLQRIHGAGRHLLALINDVLDLSKIEAGKMDLFLEAFDLDPMIDDVSATVDALVKKKHNTLQIERADDLGSMHADLTKVRQSLFNLISNAAKFTENGTITLSAKRERSGAGDWISFSVADTGIGIAPDKIDQVFEEFSQAETSTTHKFGGTGLGLAISQRFCRLMGGDVTAESTLGAGTTFTIRLPADVEPLEAEKPEGAKEPAAAEARPAERVPGRCILVIDDERDARDLIERSLRKDGFEVVTASGGDEGLRLARQLRPAAITLDVIMPGTDGWAVLRELKSDPQLRDTPVVMLSMIDDKSMGYALGATDYLTKPVDRAQLSRVLRKYRCQNPPCHALLVEDDAEIRELMCRTLAKQGWVVAEAEHGQAALERVGEHVPDLIVLDLMMPIMDGFEFMLELRKVEAWRRIPVVVATAKDLTEEDREALSGNVELILQKSAYGRDQLLQQVRELVAACRR
jgi:signal transduction histidine kinase/DNA-binding response OmpR family regulator